MEKNELIKQLLSTMGNYVNKDGLLYFKTKLETLFVKKVEGKQLSTNDYTNEEKQKLAGLNNYTLPKASSSTLGGIKVGAGLTIDGEGNLSATGGGEADSVNWQNVVGRPTKLSEFTNDQNFQTDTQVEQAITSKGYLTAVPDEYVTDTELNGKGYQTSSQVESAIASKGYQTSEQVQQAINSAVSGITGIEFSVVEELPGTGKKGVIYLLSNLGTGQNVYDEYIWVESKYEKIGTTEVDLSNYYNTENFTAITNGEIDSMFA